MRGILATATGIMLVIVVLTALFIGHVLGALLSEALQ